MYRKQNLEITGYADADYANDNYGKKSYSGYAFLLGGRAVF